jgi:hypothetical protein
VNEITNEGSTLLLNEINQCVLGELDGGSGYVPAGGSGDAEAPPGHEAALGLVGIALARLGVRGGLDRHVLGGREGHILRTRHVAANDCERLSALDAHRIAGDRGAHGGVAAPHISALNAGRGEGAVRCVEVGLIEGAGLPRGAQGDIAARLDGDAMVGGEGRGLGGEILARLQRQVSYTDAPNTFL